MCQYFNGFYMFYNILSAQMSQNVRIVSFLIDREGEFEKQLII